MTARVCSTGALRTEPNGAAACGATYQGAITCRIGDHRFGTNGVLE